MAEIHIDGREEFKRIAEAVAKGATKKAPAKRTPQVKKPAEDK